MKLNARRLVPKARVGALGVLVVLAGCSAGGGDVSSLGTVPSVPTTEQTTTTTVATTTSTTVVSTATTRVPATTGTPTTRPPVLVRGVPQVTASPSSAAVGARVRIEGTGFTDAMWKAPGALLWLTARTGCGAYAQAQHTVSVSSSGRLSGDFVVPAKGECRQGTTGDVPVTPGTHGIAFACTACAIGELEVTAGAVEAPSRCADQAFAPNSDNLAGNILATGIPCAQAEALVRKVGPQVGAVGGASRVEADGFTCVRTSRNDVGLPSSDFECTNGPNKVTFRRT